MPAGPSVHIFVLAFTKIRYNVIVVAGLLNTNKFNIEYERRIWRDTEESQGKC